jgi:hypothetical protein
MKIARILTIAAIGFAAPAAANAATLGMSLTADNEFKVYLSTNNNVLGTFIGSGSNWQTAYNFSGITLTAPQTYYIQIIGTNWTSADHNPDHTQYGSGSLNGAPNNPSAILGSFTVSDPSYHFANGSTNLLTGPGYILGTPALDNTSWTKPTTLVQVFQQNGGGIWGAVNNGPIAGIDSGASWIWSATDNGQYADFSIEITDPAPTPLPAALPLFAGGLGLVGYLASRRKRKAFAVLAAA